MSKVSLTEKVCYRTANVCAVAPSVGGNTLPRVSVTLTFVSHADIGVERFTFGFTVRDSPDFFINVTAWGNDEYVNGLSSNFSIGHCGEEVIFLSLRQLETKMTISLLLLHMIIKIVCLYKYSIPNENNHLYFKSSLKIH